MKMERFQAEELVEEERLRVSHSGRIDDGALKGGNRNCSKVEQLALEGDRASSSLKTRLKR